MATIGVVVIFLFCAFTICICDDSFQKECQNKCELTYPLHTYPYAEYQSACKRGCRLNAISQLTKSDREPNKAELSCEEACKEAYDDDEDSEFSCLYGCKQQKPIPSPSQMLQNRGDNDEDDLYTGVTFHPVFLLGSFCQGLLEKTSYYVKYSTSYYYSNSDGDTVVIRYESPQMLVQPGKPQERIIISDTDLEDAISEGKSSEESAIPYQLMNHGKNWLHCVSFKSGLPAWLVAGTLLLSSFFLIWLCCATTSTAPKLNSKVLTLDDLILLEEEEKKANKKIPLSLVEAPEAGPLPLKVLIDDSHI